MKKIKARRETEERGKRKMEDEGEAEGGGTGGSGGTKRTEKGDLTVACRNYRV